MKEKRIWIAVLTAVSLMAATVPALAMPPVCSRCQQEGSGCPMAAQKKGLKEKFLKKAHKLLMHQEELKLSEEQVGKIKNLKHSVKKDLVMKEAQIEVIGMDVKALLWEDVIDVDKVNALIEQKYDIKKAKAKMLVKAMADLKDILTDEQKKMMKDLNKDKSGWGGMGRGSMKGSMKGAMKESMKGSMMME